MRIMMSRQWFVLEGAATCNPLHKFSAGALKNGNGGYTAAVAASQESSAGASMISPGGRPSP